VGWRDNERDNERDNLKGPHHTIVPYLLRSLQKIRVKVGVLGV